MAVIMVTPALGPSLGIAPAGMWMWMFARLEEVLWDAKGLGPRPYVAHRRLRRLLHDVTELASELKLTGTVHPGALDEEDLSAHRGPGEAGRNAGFCCAFRDLRAEAGRAQVGTQRFLVGDDPGALLRLRRPSRQHP